MNRIFIKLIKNRHPSEKSRFFGFLMPPAAVLGRETWGVGGGLNTRGGLNAACAASRANPLDAGGSRGMGNRGVAGWGVCPAGIRAFQRALVAIN